MKTRTLYTVTRLQARLDTLPRAETWLALNPVETYPRYLESARNSALTSWVRNLSGEDDLHNLERGLREAWRERVDELARWLGPEWSAAMGWLLTLPALAQLRAATSGEPPPWLEGDPWLAEQAQALRSALSRDTPWHEMLVAQLPFRGDARRRARPLAAKLVAIYGPATPNQLGLEGLRERYRALDERFRTDFHRHVAKPQAILAYLCLVALGMHRLRGELTSRAALPPTHEEVAS